MRRFAQKAGKHLIGFAVIAAVIFGVLAAASSVHSATRSAAVVQVAQTDGTTRDLTIVWPNGKTQIVSYGETITPRHSEYTGPKNTHSTVIDMISFNPLDSANKAGERLTPSTFAEGDRPSISATDRGLATSKAEGAASTGEGGSKPMLGEYSGWAVMGILGIIGIFIISGVFKWLLAEWQRVGPSVVAAAETAIGVPGPVKEGVQG
jgi:hypothetical protein